MHFEYKNLAISKILYKQPIIADKKDKKPPDVREHDNFLDKTLTMYNLFEKILEQTQDLILVHEGKKVDVKSKNIKKSKNKDEKEIKSLAQPKIIEDIKKLLTEKSQTKISKEEKEKILITIAADAVASHSLDILRECLNQGLEVDYTIPLKLPNFYFPSLLTLCAQYNFLEGANLLISNGANVNYPYKVSKKNFVNITDKSNVEMPQDEFVTISGPMLYAIESKSPDIVELLKGKGAKTPLFYAGAKQIVSVGFSSKDVYDFAFAVYKTEGEANKFLQNKKIAQEKLGELITLLQNKCDELQETSNLLNLLPRHNSNPGLTTEQKRKIKETIELYREIFDIQDNQTDDLFNFVSNALLANNLEAFLENSSKLFVENPDLNMALIIIAHNFHENLSVSPKEFITKLCQNPKLTHEYFSRNLNLLLGNDHKSDNQNTIDHKWLIDGHLYTSSDDNILKVETNSGFKSNLFIIIPQTLLDQYPHIKQKVGGGDRLRMGKSSGKNQNCLKFIKSGGSSGDNTHIELKILQSQNPDLRLSGLKIYKSNDALLAFIDKDTNHDEATSNNSLVSDVIDVSEASALAQTSCNSDKKINTKICFVTTPEITLPESLFKKSVTSVSNLLSTSYTENKNEKISFKHSLNSATNKTLYLSIDSEKKSQINKLEVELYNIKRSQEKTQKALITATKATDKSANEENILSIKILKQWSESLLKKEHLVLTLLYNLKGPPIPLLPHNQNDPNDEDNGGGDGDNFPSSSSFNGYGIDDFNIFGNNTKNDNTTKIIGSISLEE